LAETDNLTVQGPSGRIVLDGIADLNEGSLDQHVTVVPNIDATLPIASTLAGGPVAGVAVFVAQEVLAKEVDNINRFEYSLSGPWDEPEVVQLKTGGTLSKLIRPLTTSPERSAESTVDDESPLPPRNTDPQAAAPAATAGTRQPDTQEPVAAQPANAETTANAAKSLQRAFKGLIDRIRQPDGELYDPLQTDQ
jgi:hypothetical protein